MADAVMRLILRPPETRAQTVQSWTVSVNDVAITRWITSG